jgi:hypothetical protein
MANPELVKFIQDEFAAGHSEGDIRVTLKSKGWADSDIDMAFSAWKTNPTLPEKKSVGVFVGESWKILKSMVPQIKDLYLKFAIPLVVMVVAVAALLGYGAVSFSGSEGNDVAGMGLILAMVVVVGLFAAYFAIWFQVSVIYLVKNRNSGMAAQEAKDLAKPLIVKYFGTNVLVGIYTMLWTFLLIIPGIIYWVRYSLAEYIVVDKNISGNAAIELSKKYVSGIWWEVMFSLLGLLAVNFLVYFPLNIISSLGEGASAVGNILSIAANLVLIPYGAIYMWLMFEKIKSLKPEVQ